MNSVFLGEVHNLRLRRAGGDFRPPPGSSSLRLCQGGRSLGLQQGGRSLRLRQGGSLGLPPTPAGAFLPFSSSRLSSRLSTTVACHGRFFSCRLQIRMKHDVALKGANFCAEVSGLRPLPLHMIGCCRSGSTAHLRKHSRGSMLDGWRWPG